MKTKITILIFTMCIGCICFGQNKIGNLSIDSETFSKYLSDCYLHPDTISKRSDRDYGTENMVAISTDDYNLHKRQANDYNESLEHISIREIIDTINYPSYQDTTYNKDFGYLLGCSGCDGKYIDSINNVNKQKEIKSGIKKIETMPAWTYINYTGKFLVARKPSEEDFIKWKMKQSK